MIARYFAPLAAAPGAAGLTDDAAVISAGRGDLVVTKDMLMAGIHFFADDPPGLIARKAIGVNLSDLAAKGARPVGFLLGLGLPPDWSEAFIAAFADGLRQAAMDWNCMLFGGDTVVSPGGLVVSITAFGRAAKGRIVRRSGARAGDVIAVSGTIGDAALGLVLRGGGEAEWAAGLNAGDRAHLIERYLKPQPRQGLATAIGRHASAAMDVSDGLVGDLAKLLATSGVGGTLQPDAVPHSAAAAKAVVSNPAAKVRALTGGDDYEVLLTASPDAFPRIVSAGRKQGIPVTAIGAVEAAAGLRIGLSSGLRLEFSADRYQHF